MISAGLSAALLTVPKALLPALSKADGEWNILSTWDIEVPAISLLRPGHGVPVSPHP